MNFPAICRLPVLPLVFLAALSFAGCKDKPASEGDKPEQKADEKPEKKADEKPGQKEGKIASCNLVSQESLCRQYGAANVEAVGEKDLKSLCDGLKGEFKMAACPTDKRVGSCVTPEGTKVFYTEGGFPVTADKAEKACKEGEPAGDWKP